MAEVCVPPRLREDVQRQGLPLWRQPHLAEEQDLPAIDRADAIGAFGAVDAVDAVDTLSAVGAIDAFDSDGVRCRGVRRSELLAGVCVHVTRVCINAVI